MQEITPQKQITGSSPSPDTKPIRKYRKSGVIHFRKTNGIKMRTHGLWKGTFK